MTSRAVAAHGRKWHLPDLRSLPATLPAYWGKADIGCLVQSVEGDEGWTLAFAHARARGIIGACSVNQRLTRPRQTTKGGVHHGMASMSICKKSLAIAALIALLALSLLRDSTEAEYTPSRAEQQGAELARICPNGARIYVYRNPLDQLQLVTDDFAAFNEDVAIDDAC